MPVKKELLHPSDIITAVREKEFADLRHLREHLRGERKYPLVFKLNLPKSSDVHEGLRNKSFITGYTDFQLAWKKFPHQEMIRSCSRNWRLDGCDTVPEALEISCFGDLRKLLDAHQNRFIDLAVKRVEQLSRVAGVAESAVFYALLAQLVGTTGHGIEYSLSDREFSDLLILLPQLRAGMGRELYLRSLPLINIDTKYIENHDKLIYDILCITGVLVVAAEVQGITVRRKIENFLGVEPHPDGFVSVVILDPKLVGDPAVTGRYRICMVPAAELKKHAPVGSNLLVVENKESGYMLPEIPDTVAVFGGGKNVSWADNDWICTKRKVAYWGDLDQSGFKILAQFRHKAGFQIPSLMMDPGTIEKHLERMCMDDSGETVEPAEMSLLTADEKEAVRLLSSLEHSVNRLEQEKLNQDYVAETVLKFFTEK